jgi:two-component system CheB/CheR fusion protein
MFGYQAAEILGRNVKELMPPPFRGRHDRYIGAYLKTGRAKIIGIGREVVGLRKDGTTFPLELAVSEFQHEGCRCFTGIVRDISSRKRLEKQILDVSEREQRRIGTDLHDGVCQEMAGIALLAKTMHHRLKAGEPVTESAAGEIASMLQDAVKHAGALARGLQPVDPLPDGLSAALRHLAADTSELFGIRCLFRCPRPVEIADSAIGTHIYRIAQECVRYAAAHAKAQRIIVRLVKKRGGIELSISDDSTGRCLTEEGADDLTRKMIHHRAQVIGARIDMRPRPAGGVFVTCHIADSKAA